MINVAYVVNYFEMGGMERCISRLVNHLDRKTFRPMVIGMVRIGAAARWIDAPGVPLVELHKREGNDPLAVLRLARVLRRHKVNVVHSHNWGTLVETVVARRLAGAVKHVHAERGTVMGGLEMSNSRSWLRKKLMHWALSRTDALVAVSDSVRQRVVDNCPLVASRIRVVPNGVDVPVIGEPRSAREAIRRQLGVGDDAFVVGSVGRLVTVKDFPLALEAIRRLVDRGRDAHLLLVGDGPEKQALVDRMTALKLEGRVHFAGWQESVGPWLAASDVYLNCSVSEGMNQSIIEAMAVGLPVVATRVGENATLVDGQDPCGIVVPPADPEALATALGEVAGDERRRSEFGERARKRFASDYGIEKMVAVYEELYSGVCDA